MNKILSPLCLILIFSLTTPANSRWELAGPGIYIAESRLFYLKSFPYEQQANGINLDKVRDSRIMAIVECGFFGEGRLKFAINEKLVKTPLSEPLQIKSNSGEEIKTETWLGIDQASLELKKSSEIRNLIINDQPFNIKIIDFNGNILGAKFENIGLSQQLPKLQKLYKEGCK